MALSKDPVEAYQETLRAFDTTIAKVEHLVAAVKDAALKLEKWELVKVNGTTASHPGGVTETGYLTIDWDRLPPGRELADAVRAWHRACQEAHAAWKNIPQSRQIGLHKPGDYCKRKS